MECKIPLLRHLVFSRGGVPEVSRRMAVRCGAAFAVGYPEAELVFVSPPPYFEFPPNTRKVLLRRFVETPPDRVEVKVEFYSAF